MWPVKRQEEEPSMSQEVNASWEFEGMKDSVPNATMIPYYCGVAGEEKAGLNCGTSITL